MKAIVYTSYGPPDTLQLKEIDRPIPRDDEVLIRVRTTTVNRTDCATIRGKPFFARALTGLLKPKQLIPGTEFAGVVEEAGNGVTTLKVGTRVFGFDGKAGSHAEYITISERKGLATIPDTITFEQAASSCEGAHYAYNSINKVALRLEDSILINGATGAIGSAAVQLAKYFGVHVTATCATKNLDLVRSLGADRVIDYTRQDFTRDKEKYRLVFDAVGKSSFAKCRRLLAKGGIYISSDLGFMAQNIFLPLVTPLLKPLLGGRKAVFPTPFDTRKSVLLVRKLMEEGRFKAVIDRTYPLEDIIEAYKYVETGQKIGNVVITVARDRLL